ncbi:MULTISPECIES: relaxase/mobilization nuclease domain-containing protein, partial [Actinomyces]
MIAAIVDGGNTAGLMMYLVGPGRANEHTSPHLVGGDGFFTRRWGEWPELSSAQGYEIARRLDQYMDEYGKRPMGDVRKYDPELDKVVVVGRGRNHVWHCSLSLRPDEPALSDEAWGRITQEFMDSLGLSGADGKAPCRWVAVRHGTSKNGGDHVHIVANIVRADGTLWSRWQDETKSSKAVNRIERAYGLHVIEAREHARGARADSAADLRASVARGQDETDRSKLEKRLRAAALGARDEGDFVWRARSMGIRVRPRFAPGHSDVVVGYSVALYVPDGQEVCWYGGGRVARDLALPRLRARWADTPQGAQRAVDAWRGAWWGEQPDRSGGYEPMAGVAQRARGLEILADGIRGIDPRDSVAMADASRDVSGALGALALACDDQGARRALERAAIVVGRQGQTHRRDALARPAPDALMEVARLATAAAADARVAALLLVIEVLRLAEALSDLHAAADQARTARDMLDSTAAALRALDARSLPQAPAPVMAALGASRGASRGRAEFAQPGGSAPAGRRRPPSSEVNERWGLDLRDGEHLDPDPAAVADPGAQARARGAAPLLDG